MINYGFCLLCAKEICPKCGDCGTRKPGSQYTEVAMTWSNKSTMQVAICLGCASDNRHATAHGKQVITKAHQDHWQEQGGQFDPAVILV